MEKVEIGVKRREEKKTTKVLKKKEEEEKMATVLKKEEQGNMETKVLRRRRQRQTQRQTQRLKEEDKDKGEEEKTMTGGSHEGNENGLSENVAFCNKRKGKINKLTIHNMNIVTHAHSSQFTAGRFLCKDSLGKQIVSGRCVPIPYQSTNVTTAKMNENLPTSFPWAFSNDDVNTCISALLLTESICFTADIIPKQVDADIESVSTIHQGQYSGAAARNYASFNRSSYKT